MTSAITVYIKERFPVVPALLFSVGYAALAIGISTDQASWTELFFENISKLILLSSTFFFFLLRQRATDEFKDAEYDKKHYPDRPLPRGSISTRSIAVLGIGAFLLEFFSALFVGLAVFQFYLLFFIYSLLMAKEFYLSNWLSKHFTTYFIIHELIFVLLGTFFLSAVMGVGIMLNLENMLRLLVLFLAPLAIEIVRKFSPRHDARGKVVADSYSVVWGKNIALVILASSLLLIGGLISLVDNHLAPLLLGVIAFSSLIMIGKESNKLAEGIGALGFLSFAILSNLI